MNGMSSEKLKLLLTWQARVPKIGTLAAHALKQKLVFLLSITVHR